MVAAIARSLGGDRITVYSAGSAPGERLNPAVVEVMLEKGIDIRSEQPQRLTDEMALSADVVVMMGCGDGCPFHPGKRYEDWVLTDPAGKELDEVRPIRDEVERRVAALVGELLGVESER
jgi:protein-tyrosine-phosphatase